MMSYARRLLPSWLGAAPSGLWQEPSRLVVRYSAVPEGPDEAAVLRGVGRIGALAVLINHYAPDVTVNETENLILDILSFTVGGLSEAVNSLLAFGGSESAAVPPESLTGWGMAGAVLLGSWALRRKGVIELYRRIMNHARVIVDVEDEYVRVRHGLGLTSTRIERQAVRNIWVVPLQPRGNEVLIQHDGGFLTVARIDGPQRRALVLKVQLEDLLERAKAREETKLGREILDEIMRKRT